MNTIRYTRRVLAAAVSAVCIVAPTPSLGLTITVNGSCTSSVDGFGNVMIDCSGSPTNPSCSVSAVPTSLPASGGPVTVSSNCGAVTSWSGAKSATPGTSTSWTDQIPPNTLSSSVSYRYSVVGANGTNFVDVTQAGAGAPPPSGSVATVCAAAGYNSIQVIEMGWTNTRYYTKGFTLGNIAIFHFRTPASTSPGNQGYVAGAENGGGPKLRHAVLSATPCDFNKGGFLPYDYSDATSPTVNFLVGGTDLYYPILLPNTDYYFNVKNDPKACTSGACEMYMDFSKPAGL
jgi:hypothetical protein